MTNTFIEENGVYSIDCSNAVWATDRMHADYQESGMHINDVDFVIEDNEHLFLVEYKNASIHGADRPEAFRPMEDKRIFVVTRKFYDSLHYLRLLNKNKSVQYIYVLEYPKGDMITRKRLRNRLKSELPFALQEKIGNGTKLIDKIDVVSIEEWNRDENYGRYPIKPIASE